MFDGISKKNNVHGHLARVVVVFKKSFFHVIFKLGKGNQILICVFVIQKVGFKQNTLLLSVEKFFEEKNFTYQIWEEFFFRKCCDKFDQTRSLSSRTR